MLTPIQAQTPDKTTSGESAIERERRIPRDENNNVDFFQDFQMFSFLPFSPPMRFLL
jgi:hypothetical protein